MLYNEIIRFRKKNIPIYYFLLYFSPLSFIIIAWANSAHIQRQTFFSLLTFFGQIRLINYHLERSFLNKKKNPQTHKMKWNEEKKKMHTEEKKTKAVKSGKPFCCCRWFIFLSSFFSSFSFYLPANQKWNSITTVRQYTQCHLVDRNYGWNFILFFFIQLFFCLFFQQIFFSLLSLSAASKFLLIWFQISLIVNLIDLILLFYFVSSLWFWL